MHGGRSSVGRARGCGPRGRRFNPDRSPHDSRGIFICVRTEHKYFSRALKIGPFV